MNELYLSESGYGLLWIMLALIFAAMGGFMGGFFLADRNAGPNRRKADQAGSPVRFNPRMRTDRYCHESR